MAIKNELTTPDSSPASTPPLQIEEPSDESKPNVIHNLPSNMVKQEALETELASYKSSSSRPGPNKEKLDSFLTSVDNAYLCEISAGCRQYISAKSSSDLILASSNFDSIFMGGLPPDVFEDELLPLFHKIDTVLSFKLIINTVSGFSKGYGFVNYLNPDSLNKAIKEVKFLFNTLTN
jgi:hypothetical protein